MAIRLARPLDDLTEAELRRIFGRPRKVPLDFFFPDQASSPAPSYAVRPVNLAWLPSAYLSTKIALLDFDEAFLTDDPPKGLSHIPREYLAPESIFALHNSPAADVWALGCIIIGLRLPWFPFQGSSSPLSTAVKMSHILGGMPQKWASFPFENSYPVHGPLKPGFRYSTVGAFIDRAPESLEEMMLEIMDPRKPLGPRPRDAAAEDGLEKFTLYVPICAPAGYPSREVFMEVNMDPIGKADAELFSDLLRRIFTFDYRNRWTARQILEHPWFSTAPGKEGEGGRAEGEEAGTKGEEARVPVEEGKSEGEKARTKEEEARLPGEEVRIEEEEAKALGEEVRAEGEGVRAEEESPKAEGEIAGTKGEEGKAEGEDTGTKGEEAKAPREEARSEGEEPGTKGEETRVPREEVREEREGGEREGEGGRVEGGSGGTRGEEGRVEGEDGMAAGKQAMVEGEEARVEGEEGHEEGGEGRVNGKGGVGGKEEGGEGEEAEVKGRKRVGRRNRRRGRGRRKGSERGGQG